jgi:SNF2 family DNA or RNA helicase
VLVLDESHAVKNRTSLTTTAAEHFAPHAEYRWLLSGTPVTNTSADIYTQIGMVTDKNPLGSFAFFKANYGGPGPLSEPQIEALAGQVAPHILRRTKDECLDLPEKTFVDVRIELPAWQRALYNQMRDALVREIRAMSGEAYRAFASTALTRLLRLSQLASNPALLFPKDARTPGRSSSPATPSSGPSPCRAPSTRASGRPSRHASRRTPRPGFSSATPRLRAPALRSRPRPTRCTRRSPGATTSTPRAKTGTIGSGSNCP